MSKKYHVGNHLLKAHIEAQDRNNRPAQLRLFLIMMAVFSYCGRNIVNICFRKNMGRKAINMKTTWLCVLLLFGIAAVVAYSNTFEKDSINWKDYAGSAVLYCFLGDYILNCAYVKRANAKENSDYEGDSILGDSTIKDQRHCKAFFEPFIFVVAGTSAWYLGGSVIGIGLIYIGVSVWIFEFVQKGEKDTMEARIEKLNAKAEPEEEFHDVIL